MILSRGIMADHNDMTLRRAGLSAEKRALLQKRLLGESLEAEPLRIPRRPDSGPVPLSFAQQRIWFLDQLAPGSPFYNEDTALRLTFALDIAALEKSVNEIVRRHEALRTSFQ